MLLALYPVVIQLQSNKHWQKTMGCGIHVHGDTFARSMFTDQTALRKMTGLGALELKMSGLDRVMY